MEPEEEGKDAARSPGHRSLWERIGRQEEEIGAWIKENKGSLASRLAMVTSEEKALNIPLGAGRYYYNATLDINAFTTPVRCHYAAPASFAGGFNFIGTTTDTAPRNPCAHHHYQKRYLRYDYRLPTIFHPPSDRRPSKGTRIPPFSNTCPPVFYGAIVKINYL